MGSPTSTTSFKADIAQLKAAMQQAQRSVKLATSEFRAATAGMDDWTKSADGLQAKLKQLKTTLSAQKSQLGILEEQLEKTTKEYGQNSAAADRVRMSINNQKAAIAQTEKEIDNYNEELQKAEKYGDNYADSLEEIDKAADQATDGFTVMKGALASLVADGIKLAINAFKDLIASTIEVGQNFEKSMASVRALSGATEEEFQLLSDTAKEFGASTQFSASEAADALGYMALAGWNANESAAALGGVLDLAAASSMDLAEASDMVTDYMSAFGMEAEQSGYFADLLAYAQANANTTTRGLGDAFQNCAANMNAAGQDIETTTAFLSMMANQGLKGSRAGTALTAVMRDMTNKMKDGKIQIGETAIAVSDAEGNFRDLTDIMLDIEKATSGMGDAQKATALSSTFTADSIKGLNLILNAGVGEAEAFEKQLRNSSGAASDMAKVMNDNLSGDLTALNSKIEGTKIQVYEALTPALRDAVGEISGLIDTIDWDKVGVGLGKLAKKVVEFGKLVINNAEGILSVLQSVGTVIATVFVVNKITAFASAIVNLVKQVKAFKAATDMATASQKLLNMAQAATPIAIVTAAVAGLAAGLLYLASKNKEAAEQTQVLTDEQLENIDAVNKTAEAYNELKASRDESVAGIQSEYAHYDELLAELDTLVDANGQVKAGYEDRVNFILTTLNEAVGTEMQLVDGVIQNYREERAAIEDLIEAKKAQAILSANEGAYTDALQNRKKVFQELVTIENAYTDAVNKSKKATEERTRLESMSAEEYANSVGIMGSIQLQNEEYAKALANAIEVEKQQKAAVGDLRVALGDAEQNYVNYNATIENYEGLASAIISGDADKIHTALENQLNDFITAETGTEDSLQRQVNTMRDNYNELLKAVESGSSDVTKEMVDDAQKMVVSANNELEKFKAKANKSGTDASADFAKGISSNSTAAIQQAKGMKDGAEKAVQPSGAEKTAGANFDSGYASGIRSNASEASSAAEYVGDQSVNGLNNGIDANSPSKRTIQSGEYFGQGFIIGINNKTAGVYNAAYNLARTAVNALKKGQAEGSPSKLTYQSGVYFVQGYMNGIASESKVLNRTVTSLVNSAFKTLYKMNGYNFSKIAETASEKFASGMDAKLNYSLAKMEYQNEKKLKEFDTEIEKIQKEQESATTKLNEESAAKKEKLQEESDKRLEALQEKYDAEEDKERKKAIKKEIDDEKKRIKEELKVEESANKKLISDSTERYEALIKEQNKLKNAYQTASQKMISEYSEAMNEYQTKAQTLIDETINGVTEKYEQRYDELIGKQNSLVEKMKSAGDLFEISGAGIMTINDLNEQTKQIKDYTNKLAQIKKKVSAELFDEIAQLDMKEGSAYISRLLQMSSKDLDAYNKAYTEKLNASEKAGKRIYGSDISKLKVQYRNEIKDAFKGLDSELEKIGKQAMKGFFTGLSKDTSYMDKEIKIFVRSMIDSVKKELKIKSPSKVMESIGDYTGEGLIVGLKNSLNNVKRAAVDIANAVSMPLDPIKADISGAVASVNSGSTAGSTSNSVVNNYNLVQNNTSPKSLSALDTYQARRRQIALIQAVT